MNLDVRRRIRAIVGLALFAFGTQVQGQTVSPQNEWSFIWVTAGDKWNVVEGTASVTIRDGRIQADLKAADSLRYTLEGEITSKKTVRARITSIPSDFYIKSPLSGTYRKESQKNMIPCGQELLHLHDGYNFLGLSRAIRPPECKP